MLPSCWFRALAILTHQGCPDRQPGAVERGAGGQDAALASG
jgi:hypothetical protein